MELLDEVEATVTEECFDGQALLAAVASEAKWRLALQRLLPKFAARTLPLPVWLVLMVPPRRHIWFAAPKISYCFGHETPAEKMHPIRCA